MKMAKTRAFTVFALVLSAALYAISNATTAELQTVSSPLPPKLTERVEDTPKENVIEAGKCEGAGVNSVLQVLTTYIDQDSKDMFQLDERLCSEEESEEEEERKVLKLTAEFAERCNSKKGTGDEKSCHAFADELLRKVVGQQDGVMAALIKRMYDKTKIEKMVEFVLGLKWQPNIEEGCNALLELMNKTGDLGKFPAVLQIDAQIQLSDPRVRGIMDEAVKFFIKKWATQIRHKDVSDIDNFSKSKNGTLFRRYVKGLVSEVYDEEQPESVDQLIKFSERLSLIEDACNVTLELYDKMNKSKKMRPWLSFFYHLKALRKVSNSKEETQAKLEETWRKLPYELKPIVENLPLCIQNEASDPMLFLYVKAHFDNHRDRVMATADLEEPHISSKWIFETNDNGTVYEIKSLETKNCRQDKTSCRNNYLYAGADFFAISEEKRRLFTWQGGASVLQMRRGQGGWQLHDHEWKHQLFRISSLESNEYLYADSETQSPSPFVSMTDFDTNNAYTLRSKVKNGTGSVWKIIEC